MKNHQQMFLKTPDGTLLSSDGTILMFSTESFKDEIAFGDKCFICGAAPGSKKFNGEDILPEWLLKRFKLQGRNITLPNYSAFRYGSYKIPCCEDCNKQMGKLFEKPISSASSGGFNSFSSLCKKNGLNYIFNWLALIFIKTHLKDAKLRAERDRRKGDNATIGGQVYQFELLHHTHCIARSFFTKAKWAKNVAGSLYIGPAKVMEGIESFDFLDNYAARTILLRFDDIFLIAVMNDCGAVMSHMFPKYLSKITEGLTSLQLRELFARFRNEEP